MHVRSQTGYRYAICLLPLMCQTVLAAPSFKDVLNVPTVQTPRISSDGTLIAYAVRTADWRNNRYASSIYVSRKGDRATQFISGARASANDPRWSPDGRQLAFLQDTSTGQQLFVTSALHAGPRRLTHVPGGVLDYEWSPDSQHIALLAVEPPERSVADRAKVYGDFSITDEYPPRASLWLLSTNRADRFTRIVGGGNSLSVTAFSVASLRNNFSFSPDGHAIAFTAAKSLNISDAVRSTLSVLDLRSGTIRHLTLGHDHWDETPVFSPDGQSILFSRTELRDFPTDNKLLVVPLRGGPITEIKPQTGTADRQPLILDWSRDGIHIFFPNRTAQQVFAIDPKTGTVRQLTTSPTAITDANLSSSGRDIAAVGFNPDAAPDAYRIERDGSSQNLSNISATITSTWPRHHSSIISWRSPDGVAVEGIVYSRDDLSSMAKVPVIELLHGGPRELARPERLQNEIYPIEQWVEEGAIVFIPNYRGSTGYGLPFERGNLFSYGRREAVDIYSGLDNLVNRGLADRNRIAVAGHSWGGYLAAFLSTSGDRYRAALVDSGIVDNRMNYVLSNGGAGKQGYLRSTPWEQPGLWEQTSAVSYIGRAKTPTLILQGEDDPVVPPENALVLRRGLSDMHVPVVLAMFKHTEHNVNRPKEQLAAMTLNWNWLQNWLWNDHERLPWQASAQAARKK